MRYAHLVERIAGKGSKAWDVHNRARKLAGRGRDVLELSIGDPDFPTPAAVVEAAVTSLRRGRTHYTPIVGEAPLREAIAARQRRLTGQVLEPSQVVVLAGAQCALFCAMVCLAEAGDEVIVFEPMYTTYEAVVGASGATMVLVPLDGERGFHLDLDKLAAAITPRTRVVLLNTPHNPTGAVLRGDEVEAVAALCRRHDLWLVSDEVYGTLTYDVPHVSPAVLPGMAERTVVVDSLSKSHAMTGWRIGWAIGPEALPCHIGNLALAVLYGLPPFVQDAAVTALTNELAELEEMRATFRARRGFVVERINRMQLLRCRSPEGSIFVMIDVRPTGLDAVAFANRLLEATGVALLPGEGFGPSAEGYVRLSFGVPSETLAEACDRIESFVGTLLA